MLRKTVGYFTLSLLLLLGNSSGNSAALLPEKSPDGQGGTLQKMIVGSGRVTMDLDLSHLVGSASADQESRRESVRFEASPKSFFTILVFNDELRALEPGSLALIRGNPATLPGLLGASANQLVIERTASGDEQELVVRDGKTGFVFFNIQGHQYDYDANGRVLSINDGRLLVTREFAAQLGFPTEVGSVAGRISITATLRAIEITQFVNGKVRSVEMPAVGTRPGPDVIVGNLSGLQQFDGSSGTQVGLAVGTESCNAGVVDLNWLANPNNDHPVIPQNLYRMSGGATNDERFEQIGQSSVKHAFLALTENLCEFGCNGVGGTQLGSGCSDPYSASINAGSSGHALGSRAWINPYTGFFPRNDSGTPNNSHTGHTHTGPSHRVLVEVDDLNTTLNPGATYYAEGQYVTPHEFAWCQTHPGECNMNNNVSYRRYNVSGTTSPFSFVAVTGQPTVRENAAIRAWTGATINQIEPAPGVDGIGLVGYKVTNPSAGVWHYEYAIYNQNIDRAIQSFSVPLGPGITLSNIGFHAPPQHPGWTGDGTVGNAGFSSTPWTPVQTADSLTWSSETVAQNQNANAIRWGTLYNFRFDSDRPPISTNATIGFFKTGAPITVAIQGPAPAGSVTPTPTPGATQAINLSTRMRVQPGDNVGIGGFIITGTAPKHVLLRAIGPSLAQFGVPNVLADPVLELHGPGGFVTITNDNWRDNPVQEAAILATGIQPTNNLEAAIDATLNPGAYTAVVSGKNNTSGVALIEVYDLSQAVLARLANISTRAFISTGDNIVIAGFTLGNLSGNARVVVRGLGPSLTAAGVANALADPMLELRDGNGALLVADNNWQDNPVQAAELIAAGLAPTNDLESAIAATLPPGLYTALLSGINNSSGIGLVEVYDRGL